MPFREFKNDQRGAVLLVGLLMGFVLVCSLSYVITVSESILHQERLQTAADAVAFQTAIWHARGMNVLAFINMAMAVALVIMVVFRIAEIVILIATIVCAIPTAGTCIPAGAKALLNVVIMENRVGSYVMKTLKYTSMGEGAVAIAVPYMATGPGISNTVDFYHQRGMQEHNAYSLSLLPTTIDMVVGRVQGLVKPRMGMTLGQAAILNYIGNGSVSETMAEGWPSLPVEADDFAQLCSRTGEVMATTMQMTQLPFMAIELIGPSMLPDSLMDAFGDTNQVMRMLAGELMGIDAVSVVMCEPLMSMVNRLIHSVTGLPGSVLRPVVGDPFKLGELEKIFDGSKFEGILKGIGGTASTSVKPAALWSLAQNGNIVLRTWASVGSQAQSRWAFAKNPTPVPGQAVASAEYYAECYDMGLPAPVEALLRTCSDDSMWRIGWTARMRRVRSIRAELSIPDITVNLLGDGMKRMLPFGSSTFGRNVIDFLLQNAGSPLADPIDAASEKFDNAFGDFIDGQVDRVAGPDAEPNDIIH